MLSDKIITGKMRLTVVFLLHTKMLNLPFSWDVQIHVLSSFVLHDDVAESVTEGKKKIDPSYCVFK